MNIAKQINVFKKSRDPFFSSTMTYLIIMIAFVGLRIFAQYGLLNFLGAFEDLAYSLIIQVGIIFGLSLLFFKGFSGKSTKQIFREFGFKKISVKSVFLCIGIAICLIFLNTAFNSIYTMILSWFGYAPAGSTITAYSFSAFLLAIFSSAVLPGFCEEFANRGVLLSGLKGLGAKKAIIISGLLFGLMHFNIGQFGYAFLAGMFFAYICLATGSIIPGMIIHFLNNAIVEYITFAGVNNLPFGNFYSQFSMLLSGDFLSSMILIFVILFSVIFLFVWLSYLLIKDARAKRIKAISSEIAENLEDVKLKNGAMIKINMPLQKMGFDIFKKQSIFPSIRQSIPLYMAIFLGAVITIMTLVWNSI